MDSLEKVIFVYNADNGFFNAIASTMHRVFSPATYECYLCHYTYDINGMRLKWKKFLDSLNCPFAFYYRTEFRAAHPQLKLDLPVILIERQNGLEVVLSAEEIHACGNLDVLIQSTRSKLEDGQPDAAPEATKPTHAFDYGVLNCSRSP